MIMIDGRPVAKLFAKMIEHVAPGYQSQKLSAIHDSRIWHRLKPGDQPVDRHGLVHALHRSLHGVFDKRRHAVRGAIDVLDDIFFGQHAHQPVTIHDRQLRKSGVAQAIMGGRQNIVRNYAYGGVQFMGTADQIAQVPGGLSGKESLIFHPEVVEEFGQVFVSGITCKSYHALRSRLSAAIFQSRGQAGAG